MASIAALQAKLRFARDNDARLRDKFYQQIFGKKPSPEGSENKLSFIEISEIMGEHYRHVRRCIRLAAVQADGPPDLETSEIAVQVGSEGDDATIENPSTDE